jgi:cytochrome c-L
MPKTTLLISALAALSFTGLAAAQDQPQQPAGAEQVEQPPIEMADGEVVFRDPLTNEVLELPEEDITPAVETFRQTGENPHTGDEEATAEGGEVYRRLCAPCHLPDGTGRIGPNLVDDTWKYPRAETDVGRFEVIHAGAAGAMQAFGDRLSQDDILRVMAHLDELQRQAQQ